MAITNIVVHPKGATHYQKFINTYYLKCVDGLWFFKGHFSKVWVNDEQLNHVEGHEVYLLAKAQLKPIR